MMKHVQGLAMVCILAVGCVIALASQGCVADLSAGGTSLYQMPVGIEMRWATAENPKGEKGAGGTANSGRKGLPCRHDFKPGESHILAEATGTSGMVRRIWITIDNRSPKMLRGIKIEMFWDGADKAAVSAPIGDFFCQGLGQMSTFQSALFSNPEGRSFNCCIPMPFRTGMKIVATNESDTSLAMLFYEVDYTIGDKLGDDTLYFHAHYRRENPTTMWKDYELLPSVAGRGRYLGVSCGVKADKKTYHGSWWGEGEVKVYVDGDKELPTLCGTGTEDYIGTGWGQGCYATLYQGCPYANNNELSYCFYRLHIPDPVYFYKEIRVTIQQIGCCFDVNLRRELREVGKPVYLTGTREPADMSDSGRDGIFERQDDWSSCVYFYLDRPTNNLPAIDPVEKRLEGL